MSTQSGSAGGLVARYLALGLSTGRHIEGFVDAYYGPQELAARAAAEPLVAPPALVARARALLADVDAGAPLDEGEADRPGAGPAPAALRPERGSDPGSSADAVRRRWLRAQTEGVHTTARILAGERFGYADEVESCYGVRPLRVPEDQIAAAHREIDEALGGSGPLAERYSAWREAQAIPPELLRRAIDSLAEDLRARTVAAFGLPAEERVDFELVTDQPWAGFNYYLGGLRSRVAINVDLPVLSTGLAHLVAHEAYPGHHTEHCRKEVGLVRRRHQLEETIFLVGTPQCLLAEGLADLGLEVLLGRRPQPVIASHLRPLGIRYDADQMAEVADASEVLSAARANAAFRLHEDAADPDVVVEEVMATELCNRARAKARVRFLLDPTWRAYITCYIEGVARCRRFVGGRPERFARLLDEQFVPSDLAE